MQPIKNELILCSQTYNDSIDFRTFGNNLINYCKITSNTLEYSNYTNYFYQLYLRPKLTDPLIEIPVIISNQGQAVKRFFTVYSRPFSGDDQSVQSEIKQIIYAKNMSLKVELSNEGDDSSRGNSLMKLPYLEITYDIASGDNVEVFFSSNYFMNPKKILRGIFVFLIIALVIVVIIVIVRMYIWTILNPYILSPDNYCLYCLYNFIKKLFKYYGILIFIWSWGVTAFWFIFYKIQYRPYVFFPEKTDYKNPYKQDYKKFYIIWGLGCAAYGLYMFFRIIEQVNCDIFFIDWEHDKEILVNTMGKTSYNTYKSPWRTIHIANQYNLLQKHRLINIPFCFCWLVMLWYFKTIKWEFSSHEMPRISKIEKPENSPENLLLRHCVGTFILFIAGFAQYAVKRILQIWIPLKKTEFLDLCSVANISVLILQDSLRGYYLHGQSPTGTADTNLHQLIQFLEEEGKGKIKGRGMTDNSNDNLQSYEVYLSYNMRRIYDGLFFFPTLTEIEKGIRDDKLGNQSRFVNIFKYIPNSLNVQNTYQVKKFMNHHLKTKIEQATIQSRIFIKKKSFKERFFDFPPSVDLTSPDIKELIFYQDPGANFEDVLFSGMEIEWLIFIIYWWQMWCISLTKYRGEFAIAIFMTYVCDQLFYKIRIIFGERNVAQKAVIDRRFL